MRPFRWLPASLLLGMALRPIAGQRPVAKLTVEPTKVSMRVGDSIPFKVTAYDAAGNPIPDAIVRVSGPRMSLVYADGQLKALKAGTFNAVATTFGMAGEPPVTVQIPVTVT